MRLALRKEFLGRLSMALHHHHVIDYKFLGVPNTTARGELFLLTLPPLGWDDSQLAVRWHPN